MFTPAQAAMTSSTIPARFTAAQKSDQRRDDLNIMIATKPTINAKKTTRDIIFSPVVHAVSAAARIASTAIFVFIFSRILPLLSSTEQ
jgi:hypothetical protein